MRSACGRFLALVALVVLVSGCRAGGGGDDEQVSTLELRSGQCVVPPKEVTVQLAKVSTVPCTRPHTQEVYASPEYGVGTQTADDVFPGAQVLKLFADGACQQEFQAWVGVPYPDSSLYFTYLLPSARSWSEGDRTVVCLIQSTGGPLSATTRNSKL